LPMEKITDRIKQLRDNIDATCSRIGRSPEEVKIVVVTQSATTEAVKQVIRLGFADLGENQVQQLKKASCLVADFLTAEQGNSTLPEKINWHMVGHIQRSKVAQVLSVASLIHSVDTLRLAEELNATAGRLNLCANVLLQVNTSREPQKYGVPVGAAMHLAEQLETMPCLNLVGLMATAPLTRDKEAARTCFIRARELFLEMQGEKIVGPRFTELSMGMSADYQIAIEQGATILRIGSAIFSGQEKLNSRSILLP